MDKLDRMKLFLRVAEAGSFSKAAGQMGIVQSTASKQVAALERRVGVQLVRRTSRGLTLTDAGRHYRDEALKVLDAVEALDDAVGEREGAPTGRIRVTCPPAFASSCLLPKFRTFSTDYPGISLEFVITQSVINLVEEGIDLAVRVGDLEDSELRSRQIGVTEAIVVASNGYLQAHGAPKTPADLLRHECIASVRHGLPRPWAFDRDGTRTIVEPKGAIRSNDSDLTRSAVKSDLGIAYAPSWLFRHELASGEVRRVLADYQCSRVPISAVWSGTRALPRRVAVFVEFVASVCALESTLRIR